MSVEVFKNNNDMSRPVDLSVFTRGNGYATLDRDRHFSASVPPYVYKLEGAPLGPVVNGWEDELRANPDRTSHPLATQVALKLIVENGEL